MQDLHSSIAERLNQPVQFPEDRFAGRGIVTCAGGQRYFTCAWVLIWFLRRVHRSQLPIQVWHLGRKEMSEAMQRLLEAEGVEVVDAEAVLHRYPSTIGGGWPLKPYAIAHSRFREVLFLDADTVPLTEPTVIFRWDIYQPTGLLLWPDVVDLRPGNPIWSSVGLEPRRCVSVDSSVIAIDKKRNFDVLDIAIMLNEHWRDVYKYLHGDKDTFLIAALLAGNRHRLIEHRPFLFNGDLIQRDCTGDAFIHHRTTTKWNLFGANQPLAEASLSQHCENALSELRKRWTGTIFHAPNRPMQARAQEAALIAQRRFHYAHGDGRTRQLELLPAGVIGDGRTEIEQHWAVVENSFDFVLQFYSGSRLVVELLRQPDGSWRGASLGEPVFEAQLVAEHDWQTWPHANEERIARSADAEITALLNPVLFASGFDAEVDKELGAALSLLNRLFDDVPELLASKISAIPLCQAWRTALEVGLNKLRASRDARMTNSTRDVVVPIDINLNHYSRII